MQEHTSAKLLRKRVDRIRYPAYLARGSAPRLFGGHGRASLSDRGTLLDYARIMVTRQSERPFYFVQLVLARKRKHETKPSGCPPTNVRRRLMQKTHQRESAAMKLPEKLRRTKSTQFGRPAPMCNARQRALRD